MQITAVPFSLRLMLIVTLFAGVLNVAVAENGDDGFCVFDLAVGDHLQKFVKRAAFDGEYLVGFEFLADIGQSGRQKDVHLFGKKAGRDVKIRKRRDAFSRDADLFFEFAACAVKRIFAGFERSGRYFKKIFAGSMTILANERKRAVGKHGQDNTAAAVDDDLAFILDIAVANLINADVKNFAVVNCLLR